MCGIFGAVGPSLTNAGLTNVLKALEHRGPDGSGVFTDECAKITFAHTRLAVLDLETGAQPMHSDDGSIVLAHNGEIYDFETIRSSLEAKGNRFRTRSDSEIIIYLYEEYGLACFEHLRGEFAFLLYDKAKHLLVAARDRFGIKPLYFTRLKDGFVFASEMKAIFASGLATPKLNIAAFDLLLDQDAANVRFPFEGIEHVPPASFMTIDLDSGGSEITSYWSAEIPAQSAQPLQPPLGDAMEHAAQSVLEHLEEAVRLRLRADVPVGLYLSGGIDSTFVGALMERNLETPLHSFSISFVGSDKDERTAARTAADFLGTTHHELAVTKDLLWANLEECVWFSELPFVSLAPVGKFLLSEQARKHVTVVLTGEGADEVFLGYRAYFQKAIRETRQPVSRRRGGLAQRRRLKLPTALAAIVQKLSLLMFDKKHRRSLASARSKAVAQSSASKPLINAVQEARIAAMPLDILCFLGDREEMAHSLEARVPFLDHKLYDGAKSIPVDLKMCDGTEKAVLREAARGIVPDELRQRQKAGFMTTSNVIDLFGVDRKLTEALRSYLSKDAFERAGIFSYGAFVALSLAAKVPTWTGIAFLKRLRRDSNKVIMYMMQAHMLHKMFVSDPRWQQADDRSAASAAKPQLAKELAC